MLKTNGAGPEAAHNDYRAARQSYADARERLTAINDEIARIDADRWAATTDASLDAAATAYLDGTPLTNSFESQLKRLLAEKEVVSHAVGIARQRFNVEREAQNNETVKSLRPSHREAATRVAACLVELAAANAEEAHIRQQAPGGALSFCSFPGVDLGRQDTQAKHFLAYLKRVYAIVPAPRTEAAE